MGGDAASTVTIVVFLETKNPESREARSLRRRTNCVFGTGSRPYCPCRSLPPPSNI